MLSSKQIKIFISSTCFKMYKLALVTFFLAASTVQNVRAQGICDLPESGTMELTGSCNFNTGLCGYEFPSTLWYVHTESFGGLIYGKIRGDDTGEKQTFALFQSNDPKVNDSVIVNSSIVSPVIYTSPVCLKFWFLMPNQNSKLVVNSVDQRTNVSTTVYQYVYKPASQWREAKVFIDPGSAYRLEFLSAKENSYGYVGVDHIQVLIALTTTLVPTTGPTTFSTTPTTVPPTTTATTTTSTTPTTTPTATTTTSTTTTPTTTTTTPTTTTTTTTPTTTTTTPTTTTTTPTTTTTVSTTRSSTMCTCKCPAVPTICAGAPIPTTTPVAPPTICDLPADQRSVIQQFSCNFDHGPCGFSVSTYPHLWEITYNRYGDPDVGEIFGDHSPEALGGYVLFNTYNHHVQNNTEHVFYSPTLLPSTKYCLTFWYNMPNNESRLQVDAVLDNGNILLLWERTSLETNGWVKVQVAIRETSYFRLQFRAWKDNDLSFFAVDDIQISTEKSIFPRILRSIRQSQLTDTADDSPSCIYMCTCPPYHVINCNTLTQSPPYTRSCEDLTGAILEMDGSCNFDDGNSCKYELPVYPHLWELVRFGYGNESIGVIDRDTSKEGDGFYAAFTTDSYRVPVGEGGAMRSPPMLLAGELCLSFRYNMPTVNSAIAVYRDSGSRRTLLWAKSHVLSKGWQQATILLAVNETFQIVFSSEKSGLEGYFAIDDIRLYSHVSTDA